MVLSSRYYEAVCRAEANALDVSLETMGVYIDAQLGLAANRRLENEATGQQRAFGLKLETFFRQEPLERDLEGLVDSGARLEETDEAGQWSLGELASGCGARYCDNGDGSFYLGKDKYWDDPYNSLRAHIFCGLGVRIDPSDEEVPHSYGGAVDGVSELLEKGYVHEACISVQSYLVSLRVHGTYGLGPEAVYGAIESPDPLSLDDKCGGDLSTVADFESSVTPDMPLVDVYSNAVHMVGGLLKRKVASAFFSGTLPPGKSNNVCPVAPGTYYRCLGDVHLLDRRGVLSAIVRLAVGDPDPGGRFSRHARMVEVGDLYPIVDADPVDFSSESGYSSDGSEFSLVARNRPRERFRGGGENAILRFLSSDKGHPTAQTH